MQAVDVSEELKSLAEEKKQCIIETLDDIKEKVQQGFVLEYVGCYLGITGEVEINCCVKDRVSAIGIVEAGKYVLLDEKNHGQVD